MKIRIFNQYLNLPLAILAFIATLLILAAPVLIEIFVYGQSFASLFAGWTPFIPRVLLFTLSVGIALTAMGLYSARQRARTLGLLLRASVAHVLALVFVAIAAYFFHTLRLPPSHLLAWTAASLLLIVTIRLIEGALLDEDGFKRRVLVYGAGQRAQNLMQLRRRSDQRGFVAVGYMPAPGEDIVVTRDKVLTGDARQLRALAAELE